VGKKSKLRRQKEKNHGTEQLELQRTRKTQETLDSRGDTNTRRSARALRAWSVRRRTLEPIARQSRAESAIGKSLLFVCRVPSLCVSHTHEQFVTRLISPYVTWVWLTNRCFLVFPALLPTRLSPCEHGTSTSC